MYGLSIAAASAFFLLTAEKRLKKLHLNTNLLWDYTVPVLLAGILGARIYHVFDRWDFYQNNLSQIIQTYKGGLGIYGGLFAGALCTLYILQRKKQDIMLWGDALCSVLPAAQSIGRLGNVFNNELLPYAYYEMAANVILFTVTTISLNKQKIRGTTMAVYLWGYATIRLLIERYHSQVWYIGNVSVSYIISLGIILAIMGIYVVHLLRSRWFRT